MGPGRREGLTAPPPLAVVARAWRDLLAARTLDLPPCRLAAVDPAPAAPPIGGIDELGALYERLLTWEDRRRAGQHYTPHALAGSLVAFAAPRGDPGVIADPACGGGAFLLAAAELLHGRGVAPAEIVEQRLIGIDIDADALVVAEAALLTWALTRGARIGRTRLRHADTLRADVGELIGASPVDLVVGNPPFQNQLERRTVRSQASTAALRDRFGLGPTRYLDTAAAFLLAAVELVRPGGRVLLVLPQSVLAASSAAEVRARVDATGGIEAVWFDGADAFAANVRVWAPVVSVGRRPRVVRRAAGAAVAPADRIAVPVACADLATWSPLIASLDGVPPVTLAPAGRLGELVTATAGFRDEYYAVVDHLISDAPDEPRVVTVGMIDPAEDTWANRPVKLGGNHWLRPGVDAGAVAASSPGVGRWLAARRRPKVLLATQGRILEAVADPQGAAVPITPVISVEPAEPSESAVWSVLAVLLAPAVTAWALERTYGTALARGALKLAAREVLSLPLPPDRSAWAHGAACAERAQAATDPGDRRAHLEELAVAMEAAYGVEPAITQWWLERLDRPRPRRAGPT